jgi:hypothetical protein
VQTWEAFNDTVTFNFTGDIASFGADTTFSMSIEDRIDWAVSEVPSEVSACFASFHIPTLHLL